MKVTASQVYLSELNLLDIDTKTKLINIIEKYDLNDDFLEFLKDILVKKDSEITKLCEKVGQLESTAQQHYDSGFDDGKEDAVTDIKRNNLNIIKELKSASNSVFSDVFIDILKNKLEDACDLY